MKVLVLNCGSSSIKYKLFDMPAGKVIAKGIVQRIGENHSEAYQEVDSLVIELKENIKDHEQGLEIIEKMLTNKDMGAIKSVSEIGACGHRVVHGGEVFTGSVKIDSKLEKVIEEFADLAPLHNPPNLSGIRAAKKMLGNIPQIACFDTAFHQTIPPVAYLYALPYEMYEKYKIRKYGFHGISHRYVARRTATLMNKGKYDVDLITCHLGNGCSITAVKNGKSVDTSMGLTPLEGLVMGTRAGDLDAAIVFHLIRKGYKTEELDKIFNKESGLLGISGISNDVRDLEEKAKNGIEKAQLALDIFAYKIKKYIGLYFAVLNGCDGIVFTGGIGENDALMRKRILEDLDNLGIRLDDAKNQAIVEKEGEIQADDSKIKVFVIPTNEEGAIARDTYAIASGEEL
ncbi:MAG: acetate kinase [bacterium]|nr:MAG: acetate kinase [bacterium]